MRTVLAVALGAVVVAAVGPVITGGLAMNQTPVSAPATIAVGPDCAVVPTPAAEDRSVRRQRVSCGGVAMDMAWAVLPPRSTAGPLMAERRRMASTAITAEDFSQFWLAPGDGKASAWDIMSAADPGYIVAVSIWVGGKPVRPGLKMRLHMALTSLFGSSYAPMVVAVTPVLDWSKGSGVSMNAAAAMLTGFLTSHPGLDPTIGTLSAIR
jgi:hypothetical protein